jgi:hypothetical protein
MSHPDDGRLHALVDGELSPADAAAIDAHVRTCPPCQARLEEARMLLGESDRIVARLDLEPRRAPKTAGGSRRFDTRVLGLAASALLVVTVGYLALRNQVVMPAVVMPADSIDPRASDVAREQPPAQTAPAAELRSDARARDATTPLTKQDKALAAEGKAMQDEAKQETAVPMPAAPGQLAGRAQEAERRAVSDTPPARAEEGVALNDLPPWKPKVAAPSAPPASARFRLDGLDVVSSRPLPDGGVRLVYSVNGTPVEFDQMPAGTPAASPAPEAGPARELTWSQDDHRLTLRSTLPAAELERLRQLVR